MFRFLFRPFRFRNNEPPPEEDVHCDSDMDWFFPPQDVHNPAAWDRYWNEQVAHDLGPPMCDLFSQDDELIQVMQQCGLRSVLCVGSGIAQEPRAIAAAGFNVSVLDLSPVALQLAQSWELQPSDLACFFDESLRRPGGQVEYVVGDLTDPSLCPGPFDVIIERRTLQLFSPQERPRALDALETRLQPEGILLSHCHHGGWKPSEPRIHFLRELFEQRGWTICDEELGQKPPGRVALLMFSTG